MSEVTYTEQVEVSMLELGVDILNEMSAARTERARYLAYGEMAISLTSIGIFESQFGSNGVSDELANRLLGKLHELKRAEADPVVTGEVNILYLSADATRQASVGVITPEMHRDLTVLNMNEYNTVPQKKRLKLYPTFDNLYERQLIHINNYPKHLDVTVNDAAKIALRNRIARDRADAAGNSYSH